MRIVIPVEVIKQGTFLCPLHLR